MAKYLDNLSIGIISYLAIDNEHSYPPHSQKNGGKKPQYHLKRYREVLRQISRPILDLKKKKKLSPNQKKKKAFLFNNENPTVDIIHKGIMLNTFPLRLGKGKDIGH